MDSAMIQTFRNFRDREGVTRALTYFQKHWYPLEKVIVVLESEEYQPRVTRFLGTTTIFFLSETKRVAIFEARARLRPQPDDEADLVISLVSLRKSQTDLQAKIAVSRSDFVKFVWENKVATWIKKRNWWGSP